MNFMLFDFYEQWFNSINVLWCVYVIQFIEKKCFQYWEELNDLSKIGKFIEKV